MNRATKIIGFVLVTLFGVYGCAKGPVDATEKNTSPGASSSAGRGPAGGLGGQRPDAAQVDRGRGADGPAAKAASISERADLKARTTERDTIATQYDSFRKNLKELLGHAESALGNSSGSSVPATIGANVAPMPSEAGAGSGN